MRLQISESDISFCALLGADIRRFLTLLESCSLGLDDTGHPKDNPFELCQLSTTWGLLVCVFHAPEGRVTKALNIALLEVTKDVVVGQDGVFVDRYQSIVEELLRLAVAQLAQSPSALPLIHPTKDIVKPRIRSNRANGKPA